ncbi:MAG: hypothetical protein IJH34_10230 [Romboutsia sp.]|nr:hypothetical protein [Romboutsia sp.]
MILYQREYDLKQYDAEVLKKYNLEPKIYIYVGATTKKMYERNSKWRYSILNNQFCVSKEIKQFIYDLKRFYKYELDMLNDEIDKKLFYEYDVLAETNDFQMLRELEQVTNASYLTLEFIKQEIVLLSKHDTKIKIDNNKIVIKKNYKIRINKSKYAIIDKEKNTQSLAAESVF